MFLNKMGLLPYLEFDPEKCLAIERRAGIDSRDFPLSAKSGAGMAGWYAWLPGERQPGKLPVNQSSIRQACKA
jgi:hydrogenase nickel incorporation protein HypB